MDRSLPNSGNECPLEISLTTPNFVAVRQELCKISAVQNLSRSTKRCTRKAIFTVFSIVAPQGTSCTKVHQFCPRCTARTLYQLSKFGPVLKTLYEISAAKLP